MPPVKKLKILFVTSEVVPFVKVGGLADVSSALPQKLQELGHQVRIVVPKYGAIDERKFKIHEVVRLKDLSTNIGEKEVLFSLRSSFLVGKKARVQIYFLDNEEYFGNRHSLYKDPMSGEEFEDNDERFILLAKSIFELIKKLGWVPDIIHCNDWQCGLVPVFLKHDFADDEQLENVKTLFTVHTLAQQGEFDESAFSKTGLDESIKDEYLKDGKLNFLKAGLKTADVISTVSESYAKEICTEEFSMGLHDVFNERKNDLFGVINGIDDQLWNPELDQKIAKNYSANTFEQKLENKKALMEKFGFDYNPDVPVISVITRLVESKGLDLIKEGFDEIMKSGAKLLILGAGDKMYHRFFEEMFGKYPDDFSCYLGFDEQLAHLIEAGSDILLLPSKYEPCGLNQMYSLVYGTVPVVRETGGLADTVINYDGENKDANGFVFSNYSSEAMLRELKRAVDVYMNSKNDWMEIVKNGMKSDFSWLNSAKKYIELYKNVVNRGE